MLAYTKFDAQAEAMLPARPAEMTQEQLTALLAELRAHPALVEELRFSVYKQLLDRVKRLGDLQNTILDTYPSNKCGCLRLNRRLVWNLARCFITVPERIPCAGHRRLAQLDELCDAYDELYQDAKDRLQYDLRTEADEAAAVNTDDVLAERLARLRGDTLPVLGLHTATPAADAAAAPSIIVPADDDALEPDLQARLDGLRTWANGPVPPSTTTRLDDAVVPAAMRSIARDDLARADAAADVLPLHARREHRRNTKFLFGNMVSLRDRMNRGIFDDATDHLLYAAAVGMPTVGGDMFAPVAHDLFGAVADAPDDDLGQAITAALARGDINEDEGGQLMAAMHPAPSWLLDEPAAGPSAAAAAAPDN